MCHRNNTTYIQKELDFLKLLVSRFHEQEKINGLELDVALQKTQEIYEQLLRIKLVPQHSNDEIKITSSKPESQPVALEVEISAPVIVSPSEKKTVEPERKIVKENPSLPSQPVREEKKPQAAPSKTEILAEKISPTDFHPINETLAQQKTGNDLSSKLQTAPLSSISSGIGLNDKFLYIRELFNGDGALYNNAIQRLDTALSVTDAMNFIRHHFNWDPENETVQKFINLVQRRHG